MIRVSHLTKRYGGKAAVEDIGFEAASGQIYGLIGFNGAGKTTVLKTIAGVYLADEGEVLFDDARVGTPEACGRLFIVADDPYFMPQATPNSMRKFYRGYFTSWSDQVFDRLLHIFGLEPDMKIAGFSKGMRRQMALLLGLSSGARYLLLDESFDGLDVSKRDILKRLLWLYAHKCGASVILSSHNMEELQDVSDRIGMIRNAHLEFDRPVSEFAQGELSRLFLEGEEVSADELEAVFA